MARESWLMVGGVICLAVSQTFAFCTNAAIAQITPDATLPNNSSVKLEGSTFSITGGTQAGSNLFHSFQQFSVPTGGTAFFNNAADIQNIISRVTGKSVSNIDGLIRTLGTANLFLINPLGIIFGKNASLNVGGSFVATTANAIEFGNQGFFSASAPNTPPLLTVNPSAFFFNQIATAPIQNNSQAPAGKAPTGGNSSGLRVRDGRSLLLLGGNVNLDGGRIRAYGGRVELGGLATPGTVGLLLEGNNWSLSFPAESTRADVSLTNGASVRVDGAGGGSIAVNARNLDISGGSALIAGIGQGLGSIGAVAGDITLDATGEIKVVGSGVVNQVQPGGVGNGGDINITAGSLSLTDGAQLLTYTNYDSDRKLPSGRGDAGDVNINVRDTVTLVGKGKDSGTYITAIWTGATRSEGHGGDININARSLSLTNAQLGADTSGKWDAGNIVIRVVDSIYLTNSDFVLEANRRSRIGSAVTKVLLANGAIIGNGGNGGNIDIQSRSLSLDNGAVLDASSQGSGNAGNIRVSTNTFAATNGGQILTSSKSSGRAGTISLNATDSITLSGSDPNFAQRQMSSTPIPIVNPYAASGVYARTEGAGDVGNLRIETDKLTVRDGAAISVNSTGSGKAAQLQVKARFIQLDNQGSITATTRSGNGGDIRLEAQDLLVMRRNSAISTTAGSPQTSGNGGNITIKAPFIVAVPGENSDIIANAEGDGRGGNINITTSGIYGLKYRPQMTELSDINASSRFGVNGTVQINTSGIEPSQGLINLPTEPVEPKVASGCTAGASQNQSRFVVTGRGGLPANPREAFNSDTVRVDWVTLNPSSDNRDSFAAALRADRQTVTTTIPTPAPIVEATGWVINAKGEVLLIASAPNSTPHSSWQTPTTCGAPKSVIEH